MKLLNKCRQVVFDDKSPYSGISVYFIYSWHNKCNWYGTFKLMLYFWNHFCYCRPVGKGGWGVRSNPLWPPKDIIYIALTAHFKCPTVGKWSTSSVVPIENHRCPSKSGCSYAGLFLEDQRRTHTHELFTPLRWKLRLRINMYVNKSLCQALES